MPDLQTISETHSEKEEERDQDLDTMQKISRALDLSASCWYAMNWQDRYGDWPNANGRARMLPTNIVELLKVQEILIAYVKKKAEEL